MPVGAIVGAGVAGAGASVIAGSKNASAINKATDAQTAGNAQSLALQRDIYAQNKGALAPFVSTGTAATSQINALLGLNVPQQQQQQPTPQPTTNALASGYGMSGVTGTAATAPNIAGGFAGIRDGFAQAMLGNGQQSGADYAAYVNANPDLQADFQKVAGRFGNNPAAYGQYHWQTYGQNEGRSLPVYGQAATGALAPAAPGANALSPQQSALSAFENFRNSAGYKFRFDQGMNALNSGYAGRGVIKSGGAIKGALDYGQNIASAEFGNYFNNLQTQQNVGAGAASAQAGVGQNFAGNITALNTANANALASGAVASANNTNGTIGGVTNALNSAVGAIALPQILKR